jgi:hypothetical protein
MAQKKRFISIVVAYVFIVAFMLPTAFQLYHHFDDHGHVVCNDQSTHLHKTTDKCKVCDFHFTPFNFEVIHYPELSEVSISTKVEKQSSSLLLHSFTITNKQLRAPPQYLVS